MAREVNYTLGVLFKPSRDRASSDISEGNVRDQKKDQNSQLAGQTLDNTGSFRYDPIGFPFKSTQQLNVDFSKFENHTFFNSAASKSTAAFEKILNQYPFDGTFKETTEFLDSLTGFEKYVFDTLPKNTGFLRFDRSVVDSAGNGSSLSINSIKKKKSSDNVRAIDALSVSNSPFTIKLPE